MFRWGGGRRAQKVQMTANCQSDPCTFCMACDRAYTKSAKGRKNPDALIRLTVV
jgi:hypothetical protein